MSKPQRLREEGQCAYCGQHDTLMVDHVIPRCLFDGVTSGVPGDVPKVGACRQCNNAKSTDDTFLRDVLVRDLRLAEHHIAQTIRHGAHERSISRGKSQYPRATSRLRFVPSPTGSGLLVLWGQNARTVSLFPPHFQCSKRLQWPMTETKAIELLPMAMTCLLANVPPC
jgi:hypothetical protein